MIVIYHYVLRLYVSVHDSQGMTIMESFQNLVKVVFALFWLNYLQKFLVLYRIDMFKHQAMDISLPKHNLNPT